jgi:rare lipoprotein A
MVRMHFRQVGLATATLLALAGCQPGQGPLAGLGKSPDAGEASLTDATATAPTSTNPGDLDAEAPGVFQVTADALWDGRPSLGGVWVASPDATDPERVILRNPDNGKFVIGALFRRERDNPGPELQISSDAAAALGLLAGQPAKVSVTALRREEAPAASPEAGKAVVEAAETVAPETADPLAGAAAAIDRAEGKPAAAADAGEIDTVALDETALPEAGGKRQPKMNADALAPDVKTTADAQASAKPTKKAAAAKAAAAPATAPAASEGARIQIGIFSVEANATRAVEALAKAGITGSVRKGEAQGKTFWMVTTRGDKSMLAKLKSAGFGDAFILKG